MVLLECVAIKSKVEVCREAIGCAMQQFLCEEKVGRAP